MIMQLLRRLIFRRPVRTLSSVEAYARWAEAYPPYAHNALMEAEQTAMMALLPPLTGRVVLDLGCGTGRYGLLAQARGAAQVIAVDNSAAMLQAARIDGRIQASSEAMPLRGASVDVILCGLALGHLPQLEPSMNEISRVLRSGGTALISDFHPALALAGMRRTFTTGDGRAFAVEHHAHLYADYHRAARRAGLSVEDVLEPCLTGDRSVADGTGHESPAGPVVIVYRLRKK